MGESPRIRSRGVPRLGSGFPLADELAKCDFSVEQVSHFFHLSQDSSDPLRCPVIGKIKPVVQSRASNEITSHHSSPHQNMDMTKPCQQLYMRRPMRVWSAHATEMARLRVRTYTCTHTVPSRNTLSRPWQEFRMRITDNLRGNANRGEKGRSGPT